MQRRKRRAFSQGTWLLLDALAGIIVDLFARCRDHAVTAPLASECIQITEVAGTLSSI